MRRLQIVSWSFLLWFCSVGLAVAEDPIVVHYSDPSLTRLEKQLRITAAQRDRFEDIVVKYRDPGNQVTATNGNESARPSTGEGPKRGHGGKAGTFGGGRRNIPHRELDELATILTPAQIQQFQQLNGRKNKLAAGEAHDGGSR
jgi:Spy/CpxP family protein refolding chaperone